MRRPLVRGRARALACIATTAGIALAGTTTTTAPVQAAAVAGDCAAAYPVADLTPGDAVTGLTVTHGSTPEEFTGEVLGVLDDGIGPDLDMVMVRLSSPEIDRVGIWQGMSGSPVYAADGRLVGAVAYGLAMGGSTVAGVTPYAAMDDRLGAALSALSAPDVAPERVAVDRTTARTIARRADLPVAKAVGGFQQLAMPLGVAGVGAGRLAKAAALAGDRHWLPQDAYAVGAAPGATSDDASADTPTDAIVAGGNLAASMSYGDITMAAIGTATSVCADRVVGFGHPLNWSGETTLGLHPADALYIQDDLVTGFKVANLRAPVGTITDDRTTGIAGTLGSLPSTADVSVTLDHGDRTRTGVSHVALRNPEGLATTTLYGLMADHLALVDGPVVGAEEVTWTIEGTDADGQPFLLSAGDLFSSPRDLTWRVGFGVGDVVYSLARVRGVTIDGVTASGDLSDTPAALRVQRIEAKQHGAWVRVGRRTPLLADAGEDLKARAVLAGHGEEQVLPIRLQVPPRLAGKTAMLQVTGGASTWDGRAPRSLGKFRTWLDEQVRNDEVRVSLGRGGDDFESMTSVVVLGRSKPRGPVTDVLGSIGAVAKGQAGAPVVVR